MKKTQLRFLAKEPDPKLQLWTNGSAAYSVARELDHRDEQSVALTVPGPSPTWPMALSLGLFRAEGGGTTGLYVSRKHLILAEALPSKEIIIIVLLTCL